MYLKNRQIKKTRVKHQCCECNRVIEIGESCEEIVNADMGSAYSFYVCDVCLAFREVLKQDPLDEDIYLLSEEFIKYSDHSQYQEFAAEFAINKMLKD